MSVSFENRVARHVDLNDESKDFHSGNSSPV